MQTTTTVNEEKNGKLVKGILVGAIVGGAVAMLDSTTRNKVRSTAGNVKDSSRGFYTRVKENPGEVKDDWMDRIQSASSVLKEAMNDAQSLYEKVNDEVVDQVNQVKEDSTEVISTAKEAGEDLHEIGSKVKEAGQEVSDTSENQYEPTNIPGSETRTPGNTSSNPNTSL
ncbi:YtxH domain-containing protein [Guptibacillus hwajinpoensis]|uniref:YtxH domain-containing protein n=1 Tax=Guptibacillus hwajinpoensis TaxID=208199 RepID=UPI001CFE1C3F|nr:YtxH domain-containing protein [Pseudalkalibacillus hwajinpoensis]WLR58619.1 YtxH domain-containing protein [Pseudalkalibacillus hwajinpoensis]